MVHVAPAVFGAGGVFGGGERYPAELARALAGHVETELVTFGPQRRTEEDDGLKVTVLRSLGRLGRQPAHPFGFGLVRRVRGADIVHSHHLWSLPTRMVGLTTRGAAVPLVVTDHGLLTDRPNPKLAARVARYLTVSEYSAQVLDAPADRTRVIYGGVDADAWQPDPEVRREGVLFVGRITPHKGIDVLIRALPEGARLTVAGTTGHDRDLPERAYPELLRALAKGKDVRFLDEVDDDQLRQLHRSAQVLVLPSVERTCYGRRIAISELLGLTLLEGSASGTPVVASRVGGMPEVVADGETGFIVEPGDDEELRDRLSLLLEDPALAQRMGEGGRQLVLSKFTWDACARRCLAAYRELV